MNSATSVTPEPSAPAAPSARRISPFYRKYLLDQAASIRASGGDDEDVRQFVQMDFKKPLSAMPAMTMDQTPDTPDNLRGVSMALVQGATMGFGDEALGALLGLATGVGARQGIKEYRDEYAAWAKEHGGAAFAAELAGGIGAGFLTGGASLPGTTTSILRGAGTGAAFGALGGAGAVERDDLSWDMLGERMKGALVGSVAGAGLGGTIGAAGKYLAPVGSAIATKITESPAFGRVAAATRSFAPRLEALTPEGRAREILTQWMEHSGIDATELNRRASGYWAREQRPTIVDLMGDQFTEFARGVLKDRTPAVQQAVKLLEQRQVEQGDRLLGQLSLRVLDNPKLGIANVYAAEDALHAKAVADSRPFYERAHEQAVNVTDDMRATLSRPEFRTAWNHAAEIANGELETGRATGLRVPKFDAEAVAARDAERANLKAMGVNQAKIDELMPEISLIPDQLPVRGIDYLKRTLQEPVRARYASREMTTATRTLRDNELGVLEARYNGVLGETVAQAPALGQALAAYSGPTASRDAVRAGYKAFKRGVASFDVQKQMAKLSPGDRDFYRIGAIKQLHERMLSAKDPLADIASQLFGGKGVMRFADDGSFTGKLNGDARRVLALFGSNGDIAAAPQAARDFFRVLAGEATLSKATGRAVSLPQQVSTQKLIESSVGSPPAVRGTMGVSIASTARQELVREQVNLSKAENNALAELFARGLRDPNDLRVLIDHLSYDVKRKPLRLTSRAIASAVRQGGAAVAGAF